MDGPRRISARRKIGGGIATVAVIALAAAPIVNAANTQTVKATFAPSKVPKKNYAPGSINVVTTTGTTSGTVVATSRAQIFFDDDLKFDTKNVARCPKSKLNGTTTQQAKNACKSAIVGSGSASVAIGGNPASPTPAVITAFNGPPSGGKPTIFLHSRSDQLALTTILTGVLRSSSSGDFGSKLDVSVPPLPFASAILRFQTKVQKKYKVKGKQHSYVSARCHDNNKVWNVKGIFTYAAPEPTKTVTAKQSCKVKQ
jgi:hypothetical protein